MTLRPAGMLQKPDIVRTLCRHLSAGPLPSEDEYTKHDSAILKERRQRQKDLLQVAVLCRSTSEIALDELWRSIDDFTHILYVFQAYDRGKNMFTDELTDVDKARYDVYASRVRELRVGKIEDVHATVWFAFLTHGGPQRPLLPNLERMAGFKINSNSLCYIMLFSPTVRQLELQVESQVEPGVARMVVNAAKPALASVLRLSISDKSSVTPSAIPFWELKQLQQLHIASPMHFTDTIIRPLATFAHLVHLELQIHSIPEPGGTEAQPGFRGLRSLSLKGSLRHVCAFMVATKPPALELLNIETTHLCPGDAGGRNSFERLQGTLPPSLRTFSATLSCENMHGYGSCDQFPNSSALLAPLLTAENLQRISIAIDDQDYLLTDTTLAEVQDTWPQLVQFKVSTPKPHVVENQRQHWHPPVVIVPIKVGRGSRSEYRRPTPPKPPSIKTLAIFAHAHPKLEELVLPTIDLRAVPALDTVPLLSHGLRHFGICSLAGGVGLIDHAHALDMLFPNLDLRDARRLSATGPRQHEKDRNAELQLLLLALQTGRTSEPARRMRATARVGERDGGGGASLGGDPHTIELVEPEEDKGQPATGRTATVGGRNTDVRAGQWWPAPALPPPGPLVNVVVRRSPDSWGSDGYASEHEHIYRIPTRPPSAGSSR
ncbi:hypothetical protein C8Q70DRAFT_918836 [Cubamyces menziesii]|nr:hypothetical protein C8Q70DRAFT_918836 [Cubamyces menziesii]